MTENRVALITGGGTGIGRAVALGLARMHIAVAVNYSRSQQEAEETVRLCRELGARAMAVQADVSRDADVQAMVDRVVSEWGRLDILVNNAGTTRFVPHHDLDELKDEDWDRIFATNVKGVFLCTRAAAKVMLKNGGGSIVNVSSVAGITGKGSSIPYCASKAAVNNLTLSLARVLAPAIRVNAVAPGFVDSRWTAGQTEYREINLKATPLKRVAQPEDVAEVVVALATGFRHVTGQIIPVEGGILIS